MYLERVLISLVPIMSIADQFCYFLEKIVKLVVLSKVTVVFIHLAYY